MSTYIGRVVACLSTAFGWDTRTADECRVALLRSAVHGHDVDFICDDPVVAAWRLSGRLGDLRVSYHGEMAERITRLLAELGDRMDNDVQEAQR